MKIKVCGLNNITNIISLSNMPIDFMGFIFFDKSKRYLSKNITPNILSKIPKTINKTGVFVDQQLTSIYSTTDK